MVMEPLLFSSIPQPQSRWKAFAAGWATQGVGIAAVLAISAMLPHTVLQVRHYTTTPLVAYEAPPPEAYQPAPRVTPKLKFSEAVRPSAIVLPRTEHIVRQP